MSKFFLKSALLLTVIVGLVSCNARTSSDDKLTNELVQCFQAATTQLNDSVFKDVVLNMKPDTVTVKAKTKSDHGNIIINITQNKKRKGDDQVPAFVSICAITSVVGIFIGPVLIVIAICWAILRGRRQRNQIIYEAMMRNYQLPAEFYRKAPKERRLQNAFAYMAWSIGLFVFFMMVHSRAIAMLMIIPFILGIGRLVSYFIESRKKQDIDDVDTLG